MPSSNVWKCSAMRSIGRGVEQVGAVLPARLQACRRLAQRSASDRTWHCVLRAAGGSPARPAARARHRARSAARTSPGTADVRLRSRPGAAPRPASRTAGPDARRRPARSRAPGASSSRNVGSPDEVRAQHQRVDEEADQPLQSPRACASGDRRADRDVVLAAVAAQQHLEGGQQRHEQRRPFAPAQRLAAPGVSGAGRSKAACAPR